MADGVQSPGRTTCKNQRIWICLAITAAVACFQVVFGRLLVSCRTSFSGQQSLLAPVDQGIVTIVMLTCNRTNVLMENPIFRTILPMDEVDQIILVWHNLYSPIPDDLILSFASLGVSSKVQFVFPEDNSLNNRFFPWPEIRTNTVFTLDDDFVVNPDLFRSGLSWSRVSPYRLTGFFPRLLLHHDHDGQLSFEYRCVEQRAEPYNALLSGGGLFLNLAHLKEYWTPRHAHLREYVDQMFNCEDILMQFMVPVELHPPLLVAMDQLVQSGSHAFTSDDHDRHFGISRRAGHSEKRSKCLEKFHHEIGWPLITTSAHASETAPYHLT